MKKPPRTAFPALERYAKLINQQDVSSNAVSEAGGQMIEGSNKRLQESLKI